MEKLAWKNLSIRRALLLFFSIGIIVPLLFFTFLYTSQLNKYLVTIESDAAQIIVSNNADQLRSIIERISYTAAYICNEKSIISNISKNIINPKANSSFTARDSIARTMRDFSNSTLYSLNPFIAVITKNGRVISLNNNGMLLEIPKEFTNNYFKQNRVLWKNSLDSNNTYDFSSTWPIYNNQKQIIGLLIISIPAKELWEELSNHPLLKYQQEIYSNNTLISSNQQNIDKSKESYSVLSKSIPNWNIKLVVSIPTYVFKTRPFAQIMLFLFYYLFLVLLLIFIIIKLSSYLSSPIKLVTERLSKITHGDYSQFVLPPKFKETNELNDNLNAVAIYINNLISSVSEEARRKEKMHYDALMAQINPHFLYNSLNSIKWIASLGGNNLAADMLSKLGSILHYYFGKEGDTILLSEELDFLEKYVDMLGIRYGNLFEYIVDIPQDLQLLNIPRFCLQPIIENSIMHGILSVTGGRVKIIANKHLDCLQIIVSDNGIGMEQEKANLLLSGETSKKHFDGIGINNVNLRIQLLYGAPFGLKIISSLSKGVTVIVKLPVLEIKTDEKSLDS